MLQGKSGERGGAVQRLRTSSLRLQRCWSDQFRRGRGLRNRGSELWNQGRRRLWNRGRGLRSRGGLAPPPHSLGATRQVGGYGRRYGRLYMRPLRWRCCGWSIHDSFEGSRKGGCRRRCLCSSPCDLGNCERAVHGGAKQAERALPRYFRRRWRGHLAVRLLLRGGMRPHRLEAEHGALVYSLGTDHGDRGGASC